MQFAMDRKTRLPKLRRISGGLTGALVLALVLTTGALGESRPSERQPVQGRETCVVCNRTVPDGGAAYLVGGQRVAVCPGCEREFLADPIGYLASLRPSNVIFDARTRSYLSDGWIWVGIYALLGLLFGGLSAQAAVHRGRSPFKGLLLGLVFLLPGYLSVALRSPTGSAPVVPRGLRKVPLTHTPIPCSRCGETNHPAARTCSGCDGHIRPAMQSEAETALGGQNPC
jgi:hypothetical protein